MFCLIATLLALSCIRSSESLKLISVGNATIPTMLMTDTVDAITYEKLSKNTSQEVTLQFILEDAQNITHIVPELLLNNVESKMGKDKSQGLSIYYMTAPHTKDSISYKIMFLKTDFVIPGEYRLCISFGNQKLCASSFIFSLPVVAKFIKPKLGLEGDPIRIACVYESYPDATEITWSLVRGTNLTTANITEITSNDRMKIMTGTESKRINETLVIEKLLKTDSGVYMCTVSSRYGKDIALVKINVKDRWAALYPFIGIVIEVIILVVAILVYEKYQIRSRNIKNQAYIDEDNNKESGLPLTAVNNVEEDTNVCLGGDTTLPTVEIEAAADKSANSVDIVRQREAAGSKIV